MAAADNRPKHARNILEEADAFRQDAYPYASAPAYETYRQYTRSSWQYDYPEKKRSNIGKKVAAIILVVLLLFAAGSVFYIWAFNNALSLASDEQNALIAQLADRNGAEPYYVLVLGSDRRGDSSSSGRSDVIMLVRVDERNKIVTMLSIPRDTPIVSADGSIKRINSEFKNGGAAAAVKTVADFTGLPISHYVEIGIADFGELIDEIGGIDIEVLESLTVIDVVTGDTIILEPGLQHINGQQAQAVARARHEYVDGDITRQNMNRQIVMEVVRTILSKPIPEIPAAVLALTSHIGSDLTFFNLVGLLQSFGTNFDDITFYSATGPTEGTWREDLGGRWLCYDNPEGWKLIIEAMDAGEDPSLIDSNVYAIIPE